VDRREAALRAARVVSLFSGLGGLDLGFVEEGFELVQACDNEPAAVASHRRFFGAAADQIDLALHDPTELADADVLIGGPPCQSFSLVGRRRPDDPRGKLVFAFLAAVAAKLPTAVVMENVPGIESSRLGGGRLAGTVVRELEALGYEVTACKLLATDYLVPQRRRRLFLLAMRGGPILPPDPQVFAMSRFGVEPRRFDLSACAAIGDLGAPVAKGGRASYADLRPSPYARMLRAEGAASVSLHESPRMSDTDRRLVSVIPPGGNYADVPDALATPRILRFKETGGRTTTYGRLHPDKPAYTINTYFRRPNVGCHFHYREERLITAREAMRFQALPDEMELSYSRADQRNALIGNAVPPLLARAIAMSVADALAQRSRRGTLRRAG
jgi:DNA (cytosine-5)-methyltransferase 1